MQPNAQETAALSTFTEEILDRKLHFLCSKTCSWKQQVCLSMYDFLVDAKR